MDHHLAGEEPGNRRNGYGKKTVITDTGQIELAVPRDRQARFDPQLIAKYQRRFPGFDDKIISMYARGMGYRRIFLPPEARLEGAERGFASFGIDGFVDALQHGRHGFSVFPADEIKAVAPKLAARLERGRPVLCLPR